MMAGIQLDVFTPLKDGPLNARQVAAVLSIDPARAAPLLYALVAIGLLTVDGDRFANTPEADYFLVRGRPSYIGMRYHAYQRRWQAMLQAAESIRTGTPQGRWAYASMSSDERNVYYLGLHTETLAAGRDLAARQDDYTPDIGRVAIYGRTVHFGAAPQHRGDWLRGIDQWIGYANSIVEE